MHFMVGPAASRGLKALGLHSTSQTLYTVFLLVLVLLSLVLGKIISAERPPQPLVLPKYLHCYRCLLETKELGCLLGSDICLTSAGSSCITLHIKNSSGFHVMVSDCRSREQMSDCSHTHPSPVFGFWRYSKCCFWDFCNNPQNREISMH
ncbi:lymphocyte antigen 6 complex locus protein G5c [Nannospalax galili]|uniref:Lymphocyte antigen 6 complex locus protein G5c n=1 Tax=Nannospalax galili TaxID=1026970 RepID=A0A8C6WA89_NANGA|nr:lymphocyte antigen 6 complex locus protein G5c [Nannospalax galili]